MLAIFGPSGSGKTTILRSIAGLYRPAHALRALRRRDLDRHRRRRSFAPPHRRAVGFVFQEYALFPHLTARRQRDHRARPSAARANGAARAEALLALVHLSGQHATGGRSELSGGERQRVALARALAREPAVLLLDEPFAAVDRAVRRRLQDEIDALRRTLDMPLILVTHDFDDVVRLATHVLMLEHGRGVACGPLPTLMSRPDLPWLRDAVGLGSVFDAVVDADASRRAAWSSSPSTAARCSRRTARSRSGTTRARADSRARSDPGDAARPRSEPAQRAGRHGVGGPRRPGVRSRRSCRSRSAACCCWPR